MSLVAQTGPVVALDHARLPHSTSLARLPGHCPRLLVSVRSLDEALRAIEGGVDVLDIKEPSRGSLGMAPINEISQIASSRRIASEVIPLSVALGEVVDWSQSANIPALPHGILFAKLGLSQCAASASWRADWQHVRGQFERQALSRLRWVAVAYSDAEEAMAPRLSEVLEEAIESKCAGLLIDTWSKQSSTLLDTIDATTLTKVANDCHAAGLFFAVAGKLRSDSLPGLTDVAADVVAIRSAACVQSDRTAEIDSNLVTDFKRELHRCFARL